MQKLINKEIVNAISQNTITGIDEGTQETITQNVDVNTQKIVDAEQKYPNIRAENISLSTLAERIGDYNKELVIETTSQNGGLSYAQSGILSNSGSTKGVYIKGAGDTLYIKDGYSDNLNIITTDTNIVVANIRAYANATLYSVNGNITANDIMANGLTNNNTLTVSSGGNVELTKAKASNIIVDGKEATVKGAITTDLITVIATDHATLDSATINYLNEDADKTKNIAKIDSYGDITLKDSTIYGKGSVIAEDDRDLSEVENNIYVNNTTVKDDLILGLQNNTVISTLTVEGNLGNLSDNTSVTNKLTVSKDAYIVSVKNVVINEIEAQTLSVSSKNANITTLTTVGNTSISTTGDTQIGNGAVGGNFTNNSDNTQITSKFDVTKDINIVADHNVTVSGELNSDQNVSITATNNTQIADANIKGNLDVITKNLNIDEMDLDGNINATVDKVVINTSNDLNVDVIKGNTTTHTDTLSVVAENIKNGTGTEDNNIYAKNIDLVANDSIATRNISLNINLPNDNTVATEAGQLANIKTTGAKPYYTKYKAGEAIITSDESIDIKGLDVDNFEITTKSTDVNLDGKINKRGNINTADKRVSVNNENLEPDYYATAQLHNPQKTINLIIGNSNDIKVRSKYVVRHNQGIVINGTDFLSSMESEDIKSAELSLKNSDRRKNISVLANDSFYKIPQELSEDSVIIRTISGEIITPDNVNNIINLSDNIFDNNKKDKKKAKVTIFDKISYQK